MLLLGSADIYAAVAGVVWPMARILALISVAPVLGTHGVPARVKIGLGIMIAIALAPAAGTMPAVEPFSGAGLAILMQQIVIGITMGFTVRITFAAVDMAGELAGLQMGLGYATFFDPRNAAATPVISHFYGLLATLVFLAIDGHLMLISALADSFHTIPVGATLGPGAWMTVVTWAGTIFAAGVSLSLPIVATLLIVNLAIGVLTRAAPQLNIFAVGFPVTIAIGLGALALALPAMTPGLVRLFQDGFATAQMALTYGGR